MKRILLFLLLTTLTFGQAWKWDAFQPTVKKGYSIDYDGSTEYLSVTPVAGSLDLNGPERITTATNRTFETSVGDWTGVVNHSVAQSNVDKKSGTYSLAMTSTAAGDATKYISLPSAYFTPTVAGEKYTYQFEARGTGILGTELTTNGTFDSDTWWVKSTGVSIADGVSHFSSVNTDLGIYKTNILTAGKTYSFTYTVSNLTSGTMRIQVGTVVGATRNTNGTYTDILQLTGSDLGVYVVSRTNGSTFDIDNVSIKEVTLPTLTLSIGGQSKSFTNISCVPSTFTKCVWNFQATSAEVSQPIKLWANQADVIYTDDMSLTQAWDLLVNVWAYAGSFATEKEIVSTRSGLLGYQIYIPNASDDVVGFLGDGVVYKAINPSATSNIKNNSWNLLTLYVNRVNNAQVLQNGLYGTNTDISMVGKVLATSLELGKFGSTYWLGQIGEILITKFTDIANSNVSASSLLSAYRNGLPSGWVGGTNVLRMKLKGSTASEMLRDYSGMNQSVVGTNIDLTDRSKATYKSK